MTFLAVRFFLWKFFSDQMNRNCLDIILGTQDKNCCKKKNRRCLDYAVNETF